jgi:dephospho-CoA kinase
MLIVALTGGIASGKSVVAEVFRSRGAHVDRADETARALMTPGRPAWESVVSRLGSAVLGPGRSIDRKKLAEAIFRDPGIRAFVDGVVHPLVQAERRATVARLEREGRTRIYVAESALVFEAGVAAFFDRIVVVSCPEETRIARLADRDGIGRAEAVGRIRSQMPDEEKKRLADYAVDTSGPMEETLAAAERVFSLLLDDAVRKDRGVRLVPLGARGGRPRGAGS